MILKSGLNFMSMSSRIIDLAANLPKPVRGMLKKGHDIGERIAASVLGNGVHAFWANALNFGDLVTPSLLREFGWRPLYSTKEGLISCGSILSWVPEDFCGCVIGTGLMRASEARRLSRMKFLAVRGELTRDAMRLGNNIVLADPGLLADVWVRNSISRKFALGIIPHQSDIGKPAIENLYKKLSDENPGQIRLISSRQSPATVAREIKSCAAIATSSLHGMIFADALGVPRVRIRLDVALDDFKFIDYCSSLGETFRSAFLVGQDISLDDLICMASLGDAETIRGKKRQLMKCFNEYLATIKLAKNI